MISQQQRTQYTAQGAVTGSAQLPATPSLSAPRPAIPQTTSFGAVPLAMPLSRSGTATVPSLARPYQAQPLATPVPAGMSPTLASRNTLAALARSGPLVSPVASASASHGSLVSPGSNVQSSAALRNILSGAASATAPVRSLNGSFPSHAQTHSHPHLHNIHVSAPAVSAPARSTAAPSLPLQQQLQQLQALAGSAAAAPGQQGQQAQAVQAQLMQLLSSIQNGQTPAPQSSPQISSASALMPTSSTAAPIAGAGAGHVSLHQHSASPSAQQPSSHLAHAHIHAQQAQVQAQAQAHAQAQAQAQMQQSFQAAHAQGLAHNMPHSHTRSARDGGEWSHHTHGGNSPRESSAGAAIADDTGNGGGAIAGRTAERVSRACVHCRASKLKCDLGRPCARCVNANRAHLCFDAPAVSRGRKKVGRQAAAHHSHNHAAASAEWAGDADESADEDANEGGPDGRSPSVGPAGPVTSAPASANMILSRPGSGPLSHPGSAHGSLHGSRPLAGSAHSGLGSAGGTVPGTVPTPGFLTVGSEQPNSALAIERLLLHSRARNSPSGGASAAPLSRPLAALAAAAPLAAPGSLVASTSPQPTDVAHQQQLLQAAAAAVSSTQPRAGASVSPAPVPTVTTSAAAIASSASAPATAAAAMDAMMRLAAALPPAQRAAIVAALASPPKSSSPTPGAASASVINAVTSAVASLLPKPARLARALLSLPPMISSDVAAVRAMTVAPWGTAAASAVRSLLTPGAGPVLKGHDISSDAEIDGTLRRSLVTAGLVQWARRVSARSERRRRPAPAGTLLPDSKRACAADPGDVAMARAESETAASSEAEGSSSVASGAVRVSVPSPPTVTRNDPLLALLRRVSAPAMADAPAFAASLCAPAWRSTDADEVMNGFDGASLASALRIEARSGLLTGLTALRSTPHCSPLTVVANEAFARLFVEHVQLQVAIAAARARLFALAHESVFGDPSPSTDLIDDASGTAPSPDRSTRLPGGIDGRESPLLTLLAFNVVLNSEGAIWALLSPQDTGIIQVSLTAIIAGPTARLSPTTTRWRVGSEGQEILCSHTEAQLVVTGSGVEETYGDVLPSALLLPCSSISPIKIEPRSV